MVCTVALYGGFLSRYRGTMWEDFHGEYHGTIRGALSGGIRTIPHLFLPPPPNVFWLNLMETIKGNLTSNRRKLAPGASQRGPLTFLPARACAQNSKQVPDHPLAPPKMTSSTFMNLFQTLGLLWRRPRIIWMTRVLLYEHKGLKILKLF